MIFMLTGFLRAQIFVAFHSTEVALERRAENRDILILTVTVRLSVPVPPEGSVRVGLRTAGVTGQCDKVLPRSLLST